MEAYMAKKIIFITTLLMMTFLCGAQTNKDIFREVNRQMYQALTEPATEMPKMDDNFFNDMSFKDLSIDSSSSLSLQKDIDSYKNEMKESKAITDAKNKISELNMKVDDLQYDIKEKDAELMKLKIKYNVLSKAMYFMINYKCTLGELDDYFTPEEIKILKEMPAEWRRKYE